MLRNNHGWGLKEMLFLSAILLVFVLVIAVLVSQLYGNLEGSSSSSKPNEYKKVERVLTSAAKKYHRKNKEVGYILSDDLILEEYLSLKDLTVGNDICEGYVTVDDNNFKPYISCENYETEGY